MHKLRHSPVLLPTLLRLLPMCLMLFMPALALAQAGDELFTGPFEQIAIWFKAVGGVMLFIGVMWIGYKIARSDGGSMGAAIGLCLGGVIIMSAQTIKDTLFPG